MNFRELTILLPCRSLEDFPVHHKGREASGLLANWAALWHPALVASAESAPTWTHAADPPDDLSERLIVVPPVAQDDLPDGLAERAAAQGGRMICGQTDRRRIERTALQGVEGADNAVLAEDFLALGYCYLQMEVLTRQMRYSTNLDEVHFQKQLVPAAHAAVQGDRDTARDKLAACFDLLAEERDHYYPVDAYLLDLTLLTPATIGSPLRRELTDGRPVNLLLSGQLLEEISRRAPETLTILKEAVREGRVGIVGGEAVERRLPLLSCETILGELLRGRALYESLLERPAQVFGRRRFGLTPILPQILRKLGFAGALHATLDAGRFPEGAQIKVRWEGAGATSIDAVARAPQNALLPETFLGLSGKLGESMDMDHVATICLAHWPGKGCSWRSDLRRISQYGAVLGRLVTADEYFRDTDTPGQLDRFHADQYHSPYLRQAVERGEADPISGSVRYWTRRVKAECAQSLSALAGLASGRAAVVGEDLPAEVDRAEGAGGEELEERLERALQAAMRDFAACLPRAEQPAGPGYLVANPFSYVRRLSVEVPDLTALPALEKPIYAAAESEGRKRVVVDIPPMGFAWVAAADGAAPATQRPPPPLAESHLLRNEFLEASIHPQTGAIQSVRSYETRGNRISQQLAFRLRRRSRGEDPAAGYTVMTAESVDVTACDETVGEISVRGRLADRGGETVAEFRQLARVRRGSRVLELEIELTPRVAPGPDPWGSYYACRFAWASETATLWRGVNQIRQPGAARRLEAPQYIEIHDASARTAILTGGLPFHQRTAERMLDTLLIVRGESARSFRLGVGVDLRNALHDGLGLLAPDTLLHQEAPPSAPASSGWLFHLSARNVVATHWAAIVHQGRVEGFRVRLLETAGRSASLQLMAFRKISSARQVDFRGESLGPCRLEEGAVRLEFSPHEWLQVEARW